MSEPYGRLLAERKVFKPTGSSGEALAPADTLVRIDARTKSRDRCYITVLDGEFEGWWGWCENHEIEPHSALGILGLQA